MKKSPRRPKNPRKKITICKKETSSDLMKFSRKCWKKTEKLPVSTFEAENK